MKPYVVILCSLLCSSLLACQFEVENESKKERKTRATRESREQPEEIVEIPLDESTGDVSLERNFYFIFDGSGSMGDPPSGSCEDAEAFADKLFGAKWAVEQFLEKVPSDVNLGLYVFDAEGQREVVPLGPNNQGAFRDAILAVRAGGKTPLAKAMRRGTDQLVEQYKRQLGYGEYRLVVVTDGKAEQIPQASEYSTKFGVPIYAIGLCIGTNHPLRKHALSYRAADNFEDLARGLEETLAEAETFDPVEFDSSK